MSGVPKVPRSDLNDKPALVGARTLDPRAPPSAQDIRDTVLIKQGDLFLIADLEGNVPEGNPNGLGLYFQDTRVLSAFELVVEGLPPTILLSTDHDAFLSEQVLTNPNLQSADGQRIAEQTIGIRRYRRILGNAVHEALVFDNFNLFPLKLAIGFRIEADFADIFAVRGLVKSEPPQSPLEIIDPGLSTVRFCRRGKDGNRRETRLHFDPPPVQIDGAVLKYELGLVPRISQRLRITINVDCTPCRFLASSKKPPKRSKQEQRLQTFGRQGAEIVSSSGGLNAVLRRGRADLVCLTSGPEDEPFIAGGVPWYATLFGRDSLLCAFECLWLTPDLARHTLRQLAQLQGQRDDPWRDEEPGKIPHEVRRGELARLGEVPFDPYYGTIDATPLWIMLLGAYYRVSGDRQLVDELRPNLEAALRWIDDCGDRDADGFLAYERRSRSGLVNQGWKDSWDAIVHLDGSIANPPIALVEAQAYAYGARRAAATLFALLGDPLRAAQQEQRAADLHKVFDATFWMNDEGTYCLALDAAKQPVQSVTSNPGHALWAGIVPKERGARLAARLLDEDLFSGWGIRTLSTRSASFNPSGYHVGTVWPHDNAIIALGLKRYGQEEKLQVLADGILAAARFFPGYRLPELFCGFARSAFGVPVRYPVACSPQAWAAATPSALLQAMLGVCVDAPAREVRIVRPQLPSRVEWLQLRRLAVGSAEVDLYYQRAGSHTAVDVAAMRGDVRVTFADAWDE